MQEQIDTLVFQLQDAIKNKTLNVHSPMSLISKGMEFAQNFKTLRGSEKKAVLMSALEKLAAGADGISGTEDDLLPFDTIKNMRIMLEKGIVDDAVNLIVDVIKGRTSLSVAAPKAMEIATTAAPLVQGCLGALFSKKKRA